MNFIYFILQKFLVNYKNNFNSQLVMCEEIKYTSSLTLRFIAATLPGPRQWTNWTKCFGRCNASIQLRWCQNNCDANKLEVRQCSEFDSDPSCPGKYVTISYAVSSHHLTSSHVHMVTFFNTPVASTYTTQICIKEKNVCKTRP